MLANLNEVIIDGNHDGVGYGHRYVNINGNHDHVRLMNLYDNVAPVAPVGPVAAVGPVATPSHGGHGIYTGNEGRGIGEIHHHGGHNEGRGIGRIATPSYSNNLGTPITNIKDYVAQFEKNIENYCNGSDSAICMKLKAGMDKTSALYNPLDGNHGACYPGAPGFPNCEPGFPGVKTTGTSTTPVKTASNTTPLAGAWVPTAAEKTYEATNPTYEFDPARPWTLPAMEDWVSLQKSGVAHPSRPFSEKYGFEPYLQNLSVEQAVAAQYAADEAHIVNANDASAAKIKAEEIALNEQLAKIEAAQPAAQQAANIAHKLASNPSLQNPSFDLAAEQAALKAWFAAGNAKLAAQYNTAADYNASASGINYQIAQETTANDAKAKYDAAEKALKEKLAAQPTDQQAAFIAHYLASQALQQKLSSEKAAAAKLAYKKKYTPAYVEAITRQEAAQQAKSINQFYASDPTLERIYNKTHPDMPQYTHRQVSRPFIQNAGIYNPTANNTFMI